MTSELLALSSATSTGASGADLDAAMEQPEISIVVPALNEELTIEEFVDWCRQGIEKLGIRAEIIIVDSSTDRTGERAQAKGARVLQTARKGLGRAYRDAIPFIRGRFVIMGDADCTYDFRELAPFLEKFRQGYDFIMGSRFLGYIEPESMPGLHRYFGTPLTTWILNLLYSSQFSDIHCGMRGITKEALVRMDLQSDSWEYASEMVLKSVQMKLATAEVPVRFLKDRDGRVSHHRRAGWLSPWMAGWINLRSMLVHGAEFFALKPGVMLFMLGLLLTLPLSFGPVMLGGLTFSLYSMLLGVVLTTVGLQSFYMGCLSQLFHDYGGGARARWLTLFSYNRSVVGSALVLLCGFGFLCPLLAEYHARGFSLSRQIGPVHHLAITGLLLLMIGFVNFIFTLVLHAAAFHVRQREHQDR
jgi:hypothetical protein